MKVNGGLMRGITVSLALIMVSGCGHQEESADARYERESRAQMAQLVAFASRHGATAPWFQGDPLKPEFMLVYQTALMRSHVQPIAFDAYLDDIQIMDGRPTAKLWSDVDGCPRVWLDLAISLDQAPAFKGKNDLTLLHIVAKDLDPSVVTNSEKESELVARGICVAVEPTTP